MQISSRFTIALHILAALETFKGRFRLTSQFLSGSIQVNPVVIRNILLQLKAAGFVQTSLLDNHEITLCIYDRFAPYQTTFHHARNCGNHYL